MHVCGIIGQCCKMSSQDTTSNYMPWLLCCWSHGSASLSHFTVVEQSLTYICHCSSANSTSTFDALNCTYRRTGSAATLVRQSLCLICLLLQTFVVDKQGKVIMAYQGPKGSDVKEHIKKSLQALKSQSGGSDTGMANDASKAGQNAPKAGDMESLKNLPDAANESYTGAETLK